MYDLLIKGRRVMDPAENRDGLLDVAVSGDKIAAIGPDISPSTARRMMVQGVLPFTISTDVTKPSVTGPAYGLTVTMSKFLELGLSLEEIVAMTTIHPARAVRIDDCKGSLRPGMDADISILEINPGKWQFPDSQEEILSVTKLIRPYLTIKAGVPIAPLCVPIKEKVP